MKDNFEKTRLRTVQYWFIDGIGEIALAVLCLIMAIYFLAQALLPETSIIYFVLNASLVLVIIGGTFLARHLIQIAKSRLTYLRTGYIAYPSKSSNRWGSALLAMGIAALVAFLIAQQPESLTWMPAISGLIFAFVMLLFGIRTKLLRFYLVGFITILIGAGLSLVGIGDILGLSAFYGLFSLVLGLSGGCTLRTYLQNSPASQESHNAE